jgi:flagellar assembly protein FliH
MSLSRIYPSNDTFQPQDIIQHRIQMEPVWENVSRPFTASNTADLPQLTAQSTREHTVVADILKKTGVTPRPQQPGKDSAETFPQRPESPPQGTGIDDSDSQPTQSAGISEAQVEQLLAEAYEKGLQAGCHQADEDFGAAAKALLHISRQLDQLHETILRNSTCEMQELAMVIAETVIRQSVQDQSATILSTVEEAIHKAVRSEEFYVFVNPADFEIITEKAAELIAGLSGLNNLMVKKDINIDRGGCRIESDNCTVDATLGSQLQIIYNQLQQQR